MELIALSAGLRRAPEGFVNDMFYPLHLINVLNLSYLSNKVQNIKLESSKNTSSEHYKLF